MTAAAPYPALEWNEMAAVVTSLLKASLVAFSLACKGSFFKCHRISFNSGKHNKWNCRKSNVIFPSWNFGALERRREVLRLWEGRRQILALDFFLRKTWWSFCEVNSTSCCHTTQKLSLIFEIFAPLKLPFTQSPLNFFLSSCPQDRSDRTRRTKEWPHFVLFLWMCQLRFIIALSLSGDCPTLLGPPPPPL